MGNKAGWNAAAALKIGDAPCKITSAVDWILFAARS